MMLKLGQVLRQGLERLVGQAFGRNILGTHFLVNSFP
jgi:hypothetical protein